MIRRGWILGCLLALSPAVSQANLLMLVDNLPGTSTLSGYAGWFVLDGMSWNIDRSNSATPHQMTVALEVSANTATFHQLAANGTVFKRVVIDYVEIMGDAATPLLVARLSCEDLIVRSSSTSQDRDERGKIELDFRCGRLAWEYYDYTSSKTPARKGTGSWNFKTNTP